MAKTESNTFFKAHTSVNRISKIFSPSGDIVDFTWNMKAIYLYILQFQGNVDSVFLSQERISQELGMDRMTVNRLLKKMELAGIYRCERGQGKSWKGFKSNVSQVISLTEIIGKDARSLSTAKSVEKEEARSINSTSGYQNKPVESKAIISNLDLVTGWTDIQLSDPVELTEVEGKNRFNGEYLKVDGQLIRAYNPEPKPNGWELDPPF